MVMLSELLLRYLRLHDRLHLLRGRTAQLMLCDNRMVQMMTSLGNMIYMIGMVQVMARQMNLVIEMMVVYRVMRGCRNVQVMRRMG